MATLKVPCTRLPDLGELRPARAGDRPAGFALGPYIRKVGKTPPALLGRPVSPVSRVARTLDAAVRAFHRRLLTNSYKTLMGVVLGRKTGADALKRPVPVALGLLGKKGIIDYRPAGAESNAERFLDALAN